MPRATLEKNSSKKVLQNDTSNEFESYLQTRRENTTYNGIELESINWHKELFGFNKEK